MNEQEAKNREMYFQAKKRHSIGRYLISDAEIVSEQEKEINRYRNKIQAMEKTIRELNMANLDLNIKLATKDGKQLVDLYRMSDTVFVWNGKEFVMSKYYTSYNVLEGYEALYMEAIRKTDEAEE